MKAGSSVFLIFLIFVSAFAATGYLASQNQSLTKELEAARTKISDLEGQNNSQSATIQDQQKQIEQKSSEVEQLATQNNACSEARQKLQTTLDETKIMLDAALATKTELEGQIITINEALGSAQAQAQQAGQMLQEMQDQLGEKDQRIAELQQGVDQAGQKIQELQDQLDRKMDENASLQSKVIELTQQVLSLSSQMEEAEQTTLAEQMLESLSIELPNIQHLLSYALIILIPGSLIMFKTLRIPSVRKQRHPGSLPADQSHPTSQAVWVKMTRQNAREYAQKRRGQSS